MSVVFSSMKHAGKADNNNLLGPKPPKNWEYFLVLESQKRVKCTSFAQHVSVIFLVLLVEEMTADNTLNPNHTWISKSCKTAELDRTRNSDTSRGNDVPTDNNIESILVMCRPFLKVFQSYVSLIPK